MSLIEFIVSVDNYYRFFFRHAELCMLLNMGKPFKVVIVKDEEQQENNEDYQAV